MDKLINTKKLFFLDNEPLQPNNFIFDNIYKNVNQKKKFENDPKYAYYNSLVKIKQNYLQNKRDVYKYLFQKYQINNNNNNNNNHNTTIQSFKPNLTHYPHSHQPTIQVQKLNSHSFKIYKKGNNSISLNKSQLESLCSDINYKLHFKITPKYTQGTQLVNLLKQYKKAKKHHSSIQIQNQFGKTLKRTSLNRKSTQFRSLNQSQNQINKFRTMQQLRKKRSKSNTTQFSHRLYK